MTQEINEAIDNLSAALAIEYSKAADNELNRMRAVIEEQDKALRHWRTEYDKVHAQALSLQEAVSRLKIWVSNLEDTNRNLNNIICSANDQVKDLTHENQKLAAGRDTDMETVRFIIEEVLKRLLDSGSYE